MRDGKKFFPLSYIDLEQGKKRRSCNTRESTGLAKSTRVEREEHHNPENLQYEPAATENKYWPT